jgi:hypothetical protein
MATYKQNSAYYSSSVVNGLYLDVMVNRPVPTDPADQYWLITPTYNLRPDLLAFDLYNDPGLWWVFAQRNPNRLKDPLFDFVEGVGIYLPQLSLLKSALGI